MRHLLSIEEYDKDSLLSLFNLAQHYQIGGQNRSLFFDREKSTKILANLFYEPSTRTSSSFFAAMKKLGYDVLPINGVQYSSVTKGESLEDTVRTLGCYVDAIALRHPEVGSAQKAAKISSVPIINAGDGTGEHPTQTLTDLYTIWRKFGRLDNLTITMMGDLKNGRTIHSLLNILRLFNVKIQLVSPDNLTAPFQYAHGVNIYASGYLTKFVAGQSDVLYMTRVQEERGSSGEYELTEGDVANFKENMIVLHPFPRNKEIPTWFDTDPRAYYFKQIKNGLYVRMAILSKILN
jgi:aspartate carbamoyltransferase